MQQEPHAHRSRQGQENPQERHVSLRSAGFSLLKGTGLMFRLRGGPPPTSYRQNGARTFTSNREWSPRSGLRMKRRTKRGFTPEKKGEKCPRGEAKSAPDKDPDARDPISRISPSFREIQVSLCITIVIPHFFCGIFPLSPSRAWIRNQCKDGKLVTLPECFEVWIAIFLVKNPDP
ncbi:MAG: hypothetical protein BWY93_00265 [Euryarchaeota archaeon ADurb.BinA087]|nr:MAG: hypothetical protein BWY93_00265 [Euryarchaeota archaeon ADurb.BinA087]